MNIYIHTYIQRMSYEELKEKKKLEKIKNGRKIINRIRNGTYDR